MAYIATNDIQSTLDTQLQTVSGLPTLYVENETAKSQSISAYCRSTLSPAKSVITSLGVSPIIEQTGLYQVDIFYPIAYGYSPARIIADSVIAAFPPGFLLLPDGISRLIILTAWSLPGVSYSNASSFWQFPIRVEWVIRA